MKILSWNVNGVRAAYKKGFLDWLSQVSPDIICLQETKAHPEQLQESLRNPQGYYAFWNAAQKKGYSGVAILSKTQPLTVQKGFGIARFDEEGRVLIAEFDKFTIINIYFPNGQRDKERLQYKLDFYDATMDYVNKLKKQGKKIITCGDYNTAHKEIDLARPKENAKTSGFLSVERAWLDRWVESGQVDIFRKFDTEPGQYTWWDLKSHARERNVGWRIDYHFVTEDLVNDVKFAGILSDVVGSDHCPVSLELWDL